MSTVEFDASGAREVFAGVGHVRDRLKDVGGQVMPDLEANVGAAGSDEKSLDLRGIVSSVSDVFASFGAGLGSLRTAGSRTASTFEKVEKASAEGLRTADNLTVEPEVRD